MSTTLDQLSIELTADVSKAEAAINKLSIRLTALNNQLAGINTQGLSSIGQAISNLGSGMQKLKGFGDSKFEALANSINKLSTVNASGIAKTASAIEQMNKAVASSSNMSSNSTNIAQMADAIRKFGYSTVPQAIANMPLLAKALNEMMVTLQKAPQVSQNLIDMTNALANLASASRGVQYQSAPKLNSSFDKIKRKIKAVVSHLKSLVTNLKHTGSTFDGVASSIGKFYASCFLVIRGIKAIGRAIENSMNYVETYNYYFVTMKKIGEQYGSMFERFGYESADKYAESFSSRLNDLTAKMTGYSIGENGELIETMQKNLGLDPNQVMNFQARIGAITNSVGILGETSVNTAKALSMLAGDLSSLTNTDLDEVMNNLNSGLIGQSRALYKYGIDITNASLSEEALANGITKSVSAMSQSEKMQLRLLVILKNSKIAYGDLANTVNTSANQYRIFQQQIQNLSRTIGNLFMPIVRTVLPLVNGLVIAINRLLSSLGFTLWGENWLKDLMEGISGGSASSGIEDLEDDLDNATDSAKALKAQLQDFDKLHVINSSSSGGSSSGGSVDLTDAISKALADYEKSWEEALANSENKANEWADKVVSIFSCSLAKNLSMIPWDSIITKGQNFGESLANAFNNTINPKDFYAVGSTISNAIKTGVSTTLSFSTNFNWSNFGESIASGINGYTENYPWKEKLELASSLGSGLADTINSAFDRINVTSAGNYLYSKIGSIINFSFELLNGIKWEQVHEKASELMQSIVDKLEETDPKSGKNGWQKLGYSLGTVISNALTFAIDDIPWAELMDGLWQAFSEAFKKVFEEHPFLTTVITALEIYKVATTAGRLLGTTMGSAVGGSIATNASLSLFGVKTAAVLGTAVGGYFAGMKIGELIFHEDADWYDWCMKHPIETLKEAFGTFFSGEWKEVFGLTTTHVSASGKEHGGTSGKYKSDFQQLMSEAENVAKSLEGLNETAETTLSSIDAIAGAKLGSARKTFEVLRGTINDVDYNFSISSINSERYMSSYQKAVTNGCNNIEISMNGMANNIKDSFSEKTWTLDGMVKGLGKTVSNAISKIKQLWNPFADELNDKLKIDVSKGALAGIGQSSISIGKIGKFNAYANGGFPEDGWFRASHGEYFGKFDNGQSVIANNAQIEGGIEEAAYRGFMRAMNSGNYGGTTVVLEGDAKGLFNIVRKEANNYFDRTGNSAFSV